MQICSLLLSTAGLRYLSALSWGVPPAVTSGPCCIPYRQDPTLPGGQVLQEAGQVSHVHATPAAGRRLLLAIYSLLLQRRKAQKPPSHPVLCAVLPCLHPCQITYAWTSSTTVYSACLTVVRHKLCCAFTVGNCLLISGKSLHFTPLGSCKGDRAAQPSVIHVSTGELTCRDLCISLLQLQNGKKITTTITIKTQFLLSEEEYSASIQ